MSKEDKGKSVCSKLYISLVGCLLYLITTGPNFLFTKSVILRFIQDLGQKHFGAAKRILRYVKKNINCDINCMQANHRIHEGFLKSDLIRCLDDFKSTNEYLKNKR